MRAKLFSQPMRLEADDHQETETADATMPSHLAEMLNHLAGGRHVELSRPGDEPDEPAQDPRDCITPSGAVWFRKNIPNN